MAQTYQKFAVFCKKPRSIHGCSRTKKIFENFCFMLYGFKIEFTGSVKMGHLKIYSKCRKPQSLQQSERSLQRKAVLVEQSRQVSPFHRPRRPLGAFVTSALEVGEGSASRLGRTLPPGKTRYQFYRRLGGPQGWSGQVRKISPPPGFDPRTVQPVGSRYTDYATRPPVQQSNTQ